MIVADANLTIYLVSESHYREDARRVFQRGGDWVVPPLWRSEFLNALMGPVRKGDLTEESALLYLEEALSFVRIAEDPPADLVVRLAVQHGLSVYDATYAALARHLGTVLITYDKKIIKAKVGRSP